MKKSLYFLSAFILFLCSCNILNDDVLEQEYQSNNLTDGKIEWRKQLTIPINAPDSILIKSDLKLLQFQEKNLLTDENQLTELKKRLCRDDNFFPVIEESTGKILLSKRTDVSDLQSFKYNFLNIEKDLDNLITLGMKIVELQWIYQDKIIYTECIVSEDTGFVYDNIISHVFIPSSTIVERSDNLGSIKRVKTKTESNFKNQHVYVEEILEKSIKNMIGMTMVKAVVNHRASGMGIDGRVDMRSSDCSVYCDVQTGGNSVVCKRTVFKTGFEGISRYEYAWTIATNGIQARIKWTGTNYEAIGGAQTSGSSSGVGSTTFTSSSAGWCIE